MSEILNGEIKKIMFQNEGDWGRFILKDTLGREDLVTGVIPQVFIGMKIKLKTREVNDQYGHQYKIEEIIEAEEDDCAGIKKFLTDGYISGIGYIKAMDIVSKYGKKSLDLFETEEGHKKLLKIKGIGEKTLKKILDSYEENKKYKDIVIFLNGAGTFNEIKKIYKKYDKDATKILFENPYVLQMDLDGFGFAKTDKIALGSGIKYNSLYRIMAGIKYLLDEARNDGHCYLTRKEIEDNIGRLLCPISKFYDVTDKVAENTLKNWEENKEKLIKNYGPSTETIEALSRINDARKSIVELYEKAIQMALENGDFVEYDNCIYTKKMYETEKTVADMIVKMLYLSPITENSDAVIEKAIATVEKRKNDLYQKENKDKIFEITDEQKQAIRLGINNRISIISGGPGRGKTTISEAIVEAFLLSGNRTKEDVIMLAPTGKAAKRISESTGYKAKTIHRAILQKDFPQNTLVIVDECSMIDIKLMKMLLDYAKDCQLVMLGDVYQIASVGPGKVLKDLIDSNTVPCIILKKGHRNSGNIANNAEKINAGIKKKNYIYGNNFVYTPYKAVGTNEKLDETILEYYGNVHKDTKNLVDIIVNDYIKKTNEYGIKNVMLCTAKKESGNTSVKTLNTIIQDRMTKGKPEVRYGSKLFRVGDRVMQTKNFYDFVIKNSDGNLVTGIFNGDVGTVVKIIKDDEDQKMVVMLDDGSMCGFTTNTVASLELAYAQTVHKCQGSEADCVLMVYTFGDFILLNRSLYYTGETRAKKEFRFYGEERYMHGGWVSAFDIAVNHVDDLKRYTNLKNFIQDSMP